MNSLRTLLKFCLCLAFSVARAPVCLCPPLPLSVADFLLSSTRDYGMYVVRASGAHKGHDTRADGTAIPESLEDAVLIKAPIEVSFEPAVTSVKADMPFTYALGYSYKHDPNFQHCAEQLALHHYYSTLYLSGCLLSGGASGGPWIQGNEDSHKLISVHSWGKKDGSPGSGGPRLDNANGGHASDVFDLAKCATFEDASNDEGVIWCAHSPSCTGCSTTAKPTAEPTAEPTATPPPTAATPTPPPTPRPWSFTPLRVVTASLPNEFWGFGLGAAGNFRVDYPDTEYQDFVCDNFVSCPRPLLVVVRLSPAVECLTSSSLTVLFLTLLPLAAERGRPMMSETSFALCCLQSAALRTGLQPKMDANGVTPSRTAQHTDDVTWQLILQQSAT